MSTPICQNCEQPFTIEDVDAAKMKHPSVFCSPECEEEYAAGIADGSVVPAEGLEDLTPTWNNDAIQFPRLLAEIIGVGLTEDQWDNLLKSMDLESADLSNLFDRAQAKWDAIKANTDATGYRGLRTGDQFIQELAVTKALKVLVTTSHILRYLTFYDPKALEQAYKALGLEPSTAWADLIGAIKQAATIPNEEARAREIARLLEKLLEGK